MVGLSLKIVINLKMQDIGHRTQDTGHRTQDSGFRIQDSGFKIQDSDHETSLCLCGYFKIPI